MFCLVEPCPLSKDVSFIPSPKKSVGQNEVHQAEFIAYQSIGQTSEKERVLVNVLLRKAEEYLRLSHVKCAGLSARTTETSNAVMCLDLAASCMKYPLDRVSRSH